MLTFDTTSIKFDTSRVTWDATQPPVPTIAPSSLWDGSSANQVPPPSFVPGIRGTGWAHEPATAVFDEPTGMRITSLDHALGISVAHGDSTGIEKVVFHLEGTSVEVAGPSSLNPRHGKSEGWFVMPRSSTFDGPADLYADIYPYNGKTVRKGPLKLWLSTNDTSEPETRSIDTVANGAADSGTTGPFETIAYAIGINSFKDGGKVSVPAGRFDFYRAASGAVLSNGYKRVVVEGQGIGVTFIVMPENKYARWYTENLIFKDCTIVTDQASQIQANTIDTAICTSINVEWLEEDGLMNADHLSWPRGWSDVSGSASFGAPGAGQNGDYSKLNAFLRSQNGQRWQFVDSRLRITSFYSHYSRNCDIEFSLDCYQHGLPTPGHRSVGCGHFGDLMVQRQIFPIRCHHDLDLTIVGTPVINGTNTDITVQAPTDGWSWTGSLDVNTYMKVLQSSATLPSTQTDWPQWVDGTAFKPQLGYRVSVKAPVQASPSDPRISPTNTFSVAGNLSMLAAGDKLMVYAIGHADCCQFINSAWSNGGLNQGNIEYYGCEMLCASTQPILFQPSQISMATATLSNSGTTVTFTGTAYSGSTTYSAGNVVLYGGALYRYVNGTPTAGNLPTTNFWLKFKPVIDDWIVIDFNTSAVDQVRIVDIVDDLTVTVAANFASGDQTAKAFYHGRCVSGFAWRNSVYNRGSVSSEYGQIEPGTFNTYFGGNTILNRSNVDTCLGIRRRAQGACHEAMVWEANIIHQLVYEKPNLSPLGWPAGVEVRTNHWETLTSVPGTNIDPPGAVAGGNIWSTPVTAHAANYVPGSAASMPSDASLRFDVNGDPRTPGVSLIGAVS